MIYQGLPGGSVTAALIRAGRDSGLFCGIGVCFGCLVTVNDGPPVRGCLTEARPGDRIERAGQHEI